MIKTDFVCEGCGAIYKNLDNERFFRCSFCGRSYGKSRKDIEEASKVFQNINAQTKLIETKADCFEALEQCWNRHGKASFSKSTISQIVDYITSKKDFNLAYKVLYKIDHLELYMDKKVDMAMHFVDKMDIIIQKEIRPVEGFMFWKSDTWGKGFRNDDYVKYCRIARRYQRREGKIK